MGEIISLRDIHVKELFLTMQRVEDEVGKSIEDILFEIIYGDDPSVALEAIKVVLEVTMSSDLTEEDFEEDPELADIIPFGNRESLEEGEE